MGIDAYASSLSRHRDENGNIKTIKQDVWREKKANDDTPWKQGWMIVVGED
jgi:hypothetical protein